MLIPDTLRECDVGYKDVSAQSSRLPILEQVQLTEQQPRPGLGPGGFGTKIPLLIPTQIQEGPGTQSQPFIPCSTPAVNISPSLTMLRFPSSDPLSAQLQLCSLLGFTDNPEGGTRKDPAPLLTDRWVREPDWPVWPE